MSARGRARRGVKRARTASRPSESESITRTRRGRSRSPPQDTGNNQAIEMLQLADALSAPQADIWIIGDSLIHHLYQRAIFRQSVNLHLQDMHVYWKGISGMRWEQLLPTLQLEMLSKPSPSFLVIQLGGNNIVDIKLNKLIKTVRHDMKYICTVFENVNVVWADILPRRKWRGASETEYVLKRLDIKRKRINRLGKQIVKAAPNGRAIVSDIDLFTSGLFLPDGTHLSAIANDILLNTYQEALLAFIQNPDLKIYEA